MAIKINNCINSFVQHRIDFLFKLAWRYRSDDDIVELNFVLGLPDAEASVVYKAGSLGKYEFIRDLADTFGPKLFDGKTAEGRTAHGLAVHMGDEQARMLVATAMMMARTSTETATAEVGGGGSEATAAEVRVRV